jgi:hypothetical protein
VKYRIIENVGGQFVKTELTDVILAWAAARNITVLHTNHNPRHRAELQGQPILPGFLGPMWDGDAIRYEDQHSYEFLST